MPWTARWTLVDDLKLCAACCCSTERAGAWQTQRAARWRHWLRADVVVLYWTRRTLAACDHVLRNARAHRGWTPGADPWVEIGGGHMASAEREPIMGVWGLCPQRGPGAEPLVRGAKPPWSWTLFVLSYVWNGAKLLRLWAVLWSLMVAAVPTCVHGSHGLGGGGVWPLGPRLGSAPGSDVRLIRKNHSTSSYSIRQYCFDFVAGMDVAY